MSQCPERPNPVDLVREARRCEAEAQRWEGVSTQVVLSVPDLVHATGRAAYWHGQARGWERAARAACGPLRWRWWCYRYRATYSEGYLWPARAPR